MNPILLQMCPTGGDVQTALDMLLQFQFVKAITCTYAFTAGFLVVGLLVYGGIHISIYARTDTVLINVVLFLLTGGAIAGQVASPGLQIAAVVILLLGGAVFTFLYYRYSR